MIKQMDARDIIQKATAKVVYSDFKTQLAAKQPNPPCQSNTCDFSGCTVNYPNYQYRLLVQDGKKACNGCIC